MNDNKIMYTSANLDGTFFDRIKQTSEFFKIPVECVFKDLVEISILNNKSPRICGILTEYQSHKPVFWIKLNYHLTPAESEGFANGRFFLKLSVSKIAFIGFLLFFDILLARYKDRLKVRIEKHIYNSYSDIKELYKIHILFFRKRLNLIQKE